MMINFETENLIIVCYPQNAGGKFLINCLGLSTDAVFQDKNLASLQLTGNYNTDNKIDYIRNKMIQTQTSWSDLDLGCQQLFGINNETYLTKIPESYSFANVISNLSHSDYKFFLVAHSEEYLKQYIARWPNVKLIIFENCSKFVIFRSWKMLRGPDWPLKSPKFDNMDILPKLVENDIVTIFKNITTFKQEGHYSNQILYWNTDLFFSKSNTIKEIQKLYQLLNLSNFNESYISEYYDSWIDKIKELNQQ
jgi:hypothetical protein